MLAARVFAAVTAQSGASVEEQVTLPQLRILVTIASCGHKISPLSRKDSEYTPPTPHAPATSVCAGLIHRSDDPADRRNLILQLTPTGRQLVQNMTERRRAAIANVLAKMPPPLHNELIPALRAFAEAAEEIPQRRAWALGWTTEQPADRHSSTASYTPCEQR